MRKLLRPEGEIPTPCNRQATLVRFGRYELDTCTGELWAGEEKTHLQEQPLQILKMVLDHPGDLVTRQDLRSQLWPGNSFGDLDDALNHAVRRLREALGDTTEQPRFIETVPRRGYRFIASVEWPRVEGDCVVPANASAPGRSVRWRRPWMLVGVAAVAIIALFVLNIRGVRDAVSRTVIDVRKPQQQVRSIAVLPLENLSLDPEQEYFADGMTEALITDLGKISTLRVISRTSVMQYKGTKKSLPEIARELKVDAILEGTVAHSGSHVRITANLLHAPTDHHLWAESYEGDLGDVLLLQDEVAQSIADQINVKLTPRERGRFENSQRVDPNAYEATLKGRETLEYATREEQFRQAIQLFQQAVDRDPTYAPAWAGLSEALWTMAAWGFEFVSPGDVRERAIVAAERALILDPNLPEAHMARAIVAADGEWDLGKAQQEFEKALELRPGYAAAHEWYGHVLGGEPLQRFEEGRQHLECARQLDPLSPWSDINLLAWWLFQGDADRALREGERACQRHPTLWVVHWQTGLAYLALGQPRLAAIQFETALVVLRPVRPAVVLSPLGLAYGLAGRQADAVHILAEMQKAAKRSYMSPFYLAAVDSGVGRMDEAFEFLDQALAQRTPWLVICVPHNPLLVALQSDPRWRLFILQLRKHVRLPPGTPDPYMATLLLSTPSRVM